MQQLLKTKQGMSSVKSFSDLFYCPNKSDMPCTSYGLRHYCDCKPGPHAVTPPVGWTEYRIARQSGPWIASTSDQVGSVPQVHDK